MKDLELYKRICYELPSDHNIEDMDIVEVDGVKYNSIEIEILDTKDEGKYQFGGAIYGIGIFNEEKGYGIIGEPLFFVEQDFSQTGSYYSYQEREYEQPYIVEKKVVVTTVWKEVK